MPRSLIGIVVVEVSLSFPYPKPILCVISAISLPIFFRMTLLLLSNSLGVPLDVFSSCQTPARFANSRFDPAVKFLDRFNHTTSRALFFHIL